MDAYERVTMQGAERAAKSAERLDKMADHRVAVVTKTAATTSQMDQIITQLARIEEDLDQLIAERQPAKPKAQ